MVKYVFPNHLQLEIIFRLLVVVLCGLGIGYERTKHRKSAGVKTYIIVAIGAAIFTMVSKFGFLDALGGGAGVDVSRVACNIVTGVSFLGAGMIFERGNRITGLNTSAGIWVMAAIGMAVGNGMYIIAFVATLLVIAVQAMLQNRKFRGFEPMVSGKIVVCMDEHMKTLKSLEKILEEQNISITTSHIKRHKDNMLTYTFGIQMPEQLETSEVVAQIASIPSVRSITI